MNKIIEKGDILKLTYPGGLHNHTEYSNLRLRDSINKADEMIDYAISLGHEVIAITEHETISRIQRWNAKPGLPCSRYHNSLCLQL